jgi:hypothetical protein
VVVCDGILRQILRKLGQPHPEEVTGGKKRKQNISASPQQVLNCICGKIIFQLLILNLK